MGNRKCYFPTKRAYVIFHFTASFPYGNKLFCEMLQKTKAKGSAYLPIKLLMGCRFKFNTFFGKDSVLLDFHLARFLDCLGATW